MVVSVDSRATGGQCALVVVGGHVVVSTGGARCGAGVAGAQGQRRVKRQAVAASVGRDRVVVRQPRLERDVCREKNR